MLESRFPAKEINSAIRFVGRYWATRATINSAGTAPIKHLFRRVVKSSFRAWRTNFRIEGIKKRRTVAMKAFLLPVKMIDETRPISVIRVHNLEDPPNTRRARTEIKNAAHTRASENVR